MNKTSEYIEEIIKLNDTQLNKINKLQKELDIKDKEIENLKEEIEQNTITETTEDLKITPRSSISKNKEEVKYGRLVKCFRNNKYFYIREVFIDGKKLNIPLI
tara:strand:- start:1458 stop:1766 length:309 start_codon:yes stop_codon:yes gene_type:complete